MKFYEGENLPEPLINVLLHQKQNLIFHKDADCLLNTREKISHPNFVVKLITRNYCNEVNQKS